MDGVPLFFSSRWCSPCAESSGIVLCSAIRNPQSKIDVLTLCSMPLCALRAFGRANFFMGGTEAVREVSPIFQILNYFMPDPENRSTQLI
jgi:hypothetical protein